MRLGSCTLRSRPYGVEGGHGSGEAEALDLKDLDLDLKRDL